MLTRVKYDVALCGARARAPFFYADATITSTAGATHAPSGSKNAPGRASLSSTMLRAEATSYESLLLLGLGEAHCNSRSPNSHPQSRPYPDHIFLNSGVNDKRGISLIDRFVSHIIIK